MLSCESRQGFFKEFKETTSSAKTTGNKIKKVDEVTYYLLRVTSPEYPEYWLYIDLSEDLTLFNLDSFLRDTWLECCGHLSSFIVMEETYDSQIDKLADNDSKSMRIKLKELLLQKDMNIGYTYDYGSSTLLDIKVVSSHRVITTKNRNKLIKISARNDEIDYKCFDCKKEKATEICTICIYEKTGGRRQSSFCKSCVTEHECGEEMTSPIVNSPRSGICGYTG
ncbi:MAG: hypothetical protein L0H55_12830 [Candidatus Nitrosocosmicus sp.]|nr:hypothetical protein [Candidatus Nitrosocosmicus sp.]